MMSVPYLSSDCPDCGDYGLCYACDGTGRVVCPLCADLDDDCPACNGTGVLACDECYGSGLCDLCNGSGTTEEVA